MRRAVFVLVAAATLSSACSGESTTSATTNPPPALTVTAVTISGTARAVGQTSQLTATATMSNGTTQDVTAQAAWQSSNTSVVIVSGSGVATGVAAGEADVTVAFSGASGSLHVKLQARDRERWRRVRCGRRCRLAAAGRRQCCCRNQDENRSTHEQS